MSTSYPDLLFSKTKFRCCVLFLVFSVLFCIGAYHMLMCSKEILWYANPHDYGYLFQSEAVNQFLLGKIVMTAMEYAYAGKGALWVFFKSLDAVDVLMVSFAFVILFQSSPHVHCASIRVFTGFLIAAGFVTLMVYSLFAGLASVQLTSEAGFAFLKAGAEVGRFSGFGLISVCFAMNALLWMMKEEK